MKLKYQPEIVKNHMRILFKSDSPEDLHDYIFKKLNYEIIPTSGFEWYTIKVDDYKKAKKSLRKYSEFIEWIEPRDIKWEKRINLISDLENMVQDLDDSASDWDFYEKVESLKDYLSKVSKKNL